VAVDPVAALTRTVDRLGGAQEIVVINPPCAEGDRDLNRDIPAATLCNAK
jgi:hypothetical protein